MTTIITRKVNGSGPYAYVVRYEGGEHHWEYLGRADEAELPDDADEQEQLKLEEAAALVNASADEPERGREPDPVEINFHTRGAANELRDRISDDHLADDDDRRSKTIKIDDDAPLAIQNLAAGAAADSKAHLADQGGQEPLTDAEKREIDFSETNVMHARSVKGRMTNAGVDDWLDHYDPTLAVDEHDPEAALHDDRGDRLDADDTREAQLQREGEAYRRAASEREDHARQGCIDGHEEACEELRAIGWTDDEIAELERYADPEEFARIVNDERKRAGRSAVA